MRTVGVVLVVFFWLSSSAVAEEGGMSKDFAYGYVLKVAENGAVYSLPVPSEVYMTVRRADLGDVRVFNSAGEPVPHTLRLLQSVDEVKRNTEDIPFFPLFEDDPLATDTMSLSVRRNNDGTIIDIDSNKVAAKGDAAPTSYLLDLGEEPRDVGTLELHWDADKKHSSSSVTVQQSADLQSWWTLVHKATLIDLEYEGNRIEQRKIELLEQPQRYLKISWMPSSPPLDITRIAASSRPLVPEENLQWVHLYNGERVKVEGYTGIDFTSEYRLPVRSATLQFTEPNSIISASLQSRVDTSDQWHEQCRGLFYSLQINGEQLQSEPCSLKGTTDRQWRLVVMDDGAGLKGSSQNVTLNLGWLSDELLFLARGTGPFLLAYGNGKLENSGAVERSDMVLKAVQQLHDDTIVESAILGKKLVLGGDNALLVPPPPKPWKTWLLWGVLVAGVFAMGAMAISLVKDLRNKNEGAAQGK